jgi:chromosome segregation ATPase
VNSEQGSQLDQLQDDIHQKIEELTEKDKKLTAKMNQVETYSSQLNEIEGNYKLILNANTEYEKIVSDQAQRYNHLKAR